jgi:MFS family permease
MSEKSSRAIPTNVGRLLVGSCLSMAVIGIAFAVRGDTIGDQGTQFSLTHAQMGWIASAAYWGFVISIVISGQICDLIGMRRLLYLACLCHTGGALLTIFASGFWTLWLGTLSIGLGSTAVEGAVNPLIATIFSKDKTAKLNAVHAWFPWGIVCGGIVVFLMAKLGFGWKAKTSLVLAPAAAYGFLFWGQQFPRTERVQLGVSTSSMYREALRPRLLIWICCMLLTASTELGPNQWIPNILTETCRFPGVLILVWINTLMAIGRTLVGERGHRFPALALLMVAALVAVCGLLALSFANTAVSALLGSTLFAVGVCIFWPTMLALTAEWFPNGGAPLLALMGGAGNLSVAIALPAIGRLYDLQGPASALRNVTFLPLCLLAAFGAIWYYDHRNTLQEGIRPLAQP